MVNTEDFGSSIIGSSPIGTTYASLVQWKEPGISNPIMIVRFYQEVHNRLCGVMVCISYCQYEG